jgi:hypothetical protein
MAGRLNLMFWRVMLTVAAAFGAGHGAHAEPAKYHLEVTPTGSQASPPVVLDCAENAICEGQIVLLDIKPAD